jgi:hypothetical protein
VLNVDTRLRDAHSCLRPGDPTAGRQPASSLDPAPAASRFRTVGRRRGMKSKGPVVNVALVVGAVAFLVPGVWAFVAPVGFADTIATFDPYNRHYLHDLGAFQIGVGVCALAALRWRDGAVVALSGLFAASAVHAVSHFVDRGLGGRSADAPLLTGLAQLVLAGLVGRVRALGRHRRTAAVGG